MRYSRALFIHSVFLSLPPSTSSPGSSSVPSQPSISLLPISAAVEVVVVVEVYRRRTDLEYSQSIIEDGSARNASKLYRENSFWRVPREEVVVK